MNNRKEIIVYSENNSPFDKIKEFFAKLCRNNITVSGKRDYFSLPILLFIIIAVVAFHVALPVIIISLFCGIEYVLSGPDFAEEKAISFRPDNK